MGQKKGTKRRNLKGCYLSKEVARLTGMTRDMVTYLHRVRVLVPSISHAGLPEHVRPTYGKVRLYSFTDLLQARAIAHLLEHAVSVVTIRQSLYYLRDRFHKDLAQVGKSEVVISGKDIYLREPNKSPVALSRDGQLAFSFLMDVPLLSEAAKKAVKTRSKRDVAQVRRQLRRVERRQLHAVNWRSA